MQDPRSLASIKNLDSYRAWSQEAARRSGFLPMIMIVVAFTPMLTLAIILFKPTATADAHAWLIRTGAAFAYLMLALGLTLFAVLRLNAWKRAHPWEPPPTPVWT